MAPIRKGEGYFIYKRKADSYGAIGGDKEEISPKLLYENISNLIKPAKASGYKAVKVASIEEINERWDTILTGEAEIKSKWSETKGWWNFKEAMDAIKKE